MDILEIAKQSGMLVLLDARIGQQEYHSISCSLCALERFAETVRTFASGASQRDDAGELLATISMQIAPALVNRGTEESRHGTGTASLAVVSAQAVDGRQHMLPRSFPIERPFLLTA